MREETIETYVPRARIDMKERKSTLEIRRFVTEHYCDKCNAGYRYYDSTCPQCGGATSARQIEEVEPSINAKVAAYQPWYDNRSKRMITSSHEERRWEKRYNRVNLRDTGELRTPFIKEKVAEYKYKVRNGLA